MPNYVVEKTMLALNEVGKPVRGSKVLVLGLAYKPDVDDVRESPAIQLIELFEKLGAKVRYSDPHVSVPPKMREHDLGHHTSIELSPQVLADFDVVVVATDHKRFDWDMLAAHAPLVIDTRNALASRMHGQANYRKA